MRGKLVLLAVLLPCFSQAAVTVVAKNYGLPPLLAATTNPIVFNGVLAPAGQGTIAVGIFGAADANIMAVGNDPAAWAVVAATFQQFGAAFTIGAGAGPTPGTEGVFQTPHVAQVPGTAFSGKNVYVVIGNRLTLATSSHWIVFKSNTLFAEEPTTQVNALLADAAVGQEPDGQLLLGTYDSGRVWYSANAIPATPWADQILTAIIAAGVPEPTTALLGVLALGLSSIRRRSTGA